MLRFVRKNLNTYCYSFTPFVLLSVKVHLVNHKKVSMTVFTRIKINHSSGCRYYTSLNNHLYIKVHQYHCRFTR